jgi:lipopolysaccharide/colanic/teichoic acid biosynthesis glycosyltransferase
MAVGGVHPAYERVKLLLDFSVAAAVLALLSPLWLVIAVAIRMTSPGPVLFRRTVIGRGGRPFVYFKFRSMVAGDDHHHRAWLEEFVRNDRPYKDGQFKVANDPRVTRVGRVLRRTSLDEIPQLLNVLRGEMSVIGPRPPIEHEFALYDDRARQRLLVKPGITGLYQVTARSAVPFSQMVAIDLDYINRRSLKLDAWILFQTLGAVWKGGGAA